MAGRISSFVTCLQFLLLIASAFADPQSKSQLSGDTGSVAALSALPGGDVEAQLTDRFPTSKNQLAPHELVYEGTTLDHILPPIIHSTPELSIITAIVPGDGKSNPVPTAGDVPSLCSEVVRSELGGTCGFPAELSEGNGVIGNKREGEQRSMRKELDGVAVDRDASKSETVQSKLDEVVGMMETDGGLEEGEGVGGLGEGTSRAQQQAGRGVASSLLPDLERLRALLAMERHRVQEMESLLTRITYLVQTASGGEGDRWQDVMRDRAARAVESVPSSAAGGQLAPIAAASKDPVVGKKRATWEEWFDFLAAVRLEAEVACILVGRVTAGMQGRVLPHEGEDGSSRYIAVGDVCGKIYIFSPSGELLLKHQTSSSSATTAMLAVPIRRNDTWLVSGHLDGTVLIHQLGEWGGLSMRLLVPLGGPGGDGEVKGLEGSLREVRESRDSESPSLPLLRGGESNPFGALPSSGQRPASPAITHLELYRSGSFRYILVADTASRLRLFRSNGSLYGAATSPSRPLVFLRTPSTQRILFLTGAGAASLDLKTMEVRSRPCRGMENVSAVVAYSLDGSGRSKAFGSTEGGEVVHVALTGDTNSFECHVRAKGVGGEAGIHPVAPRGLPGYLLVAGPGHVSVWNVTSKASLFPGSSAARSQGLRHLFTSPIAHLSSAFIPMGGVGSVNAFPTLACNKDRLVAVGFGGGYIGFYQSNLPHSRPPIKLGSRLWSCPLWVVIVILVVVWQFWRGGGGGSTGQHLGSHGVNGPPTPSPPLPHTPIKYRGFEDSVGGDRKDGERKLRGKREEVPGVDKGERGGAEGVVKKRSLAMERMMAEEGGEGLERRGSRNFTRSASNIS